MTYDIFKLIACKDYIVISHRNNGKEKRLKIGYEFQSEINHAFKICSDPFWEGNETVFEVKTENADKRRVRKKNPKNT